MTTWNSTANSPDRYVRVGTGGAIETNDDPTAFDNVWVSQTSGISDDLYAVAWNGFRFVAVGENGVGLTSVDGLNPWAPVTLGVATDLYGLAVGGNVFIACGAAGVLLASQTGLSWTALDSGTTYDLWGITADNAEYIAVGDNDVIIIGLIISTLLDIILSPTVGMSDALDSNAILQVSISEGVRFDDLTNRATFATTPVLVAVTEHFSLLEDGDTDIGGVIESGFDQTSSNLDVAIDERVLLDEVDAWRYQGDYAETFFTFLDDSVALSSVESTDQIIVNASGVDSFTLNDRPFINNEALSDAFALSATLVGAYGRTILEAVGINDAIEALAAFTHVASETIAIGDSSVPIGTMLITLSESVALDDSLSPSQIIEMLVSEGVAFSVALTLDGETYLAWVMNTETFGLTNYENFRFNSMTGFGGEYYATDGDKIYRLGGDDDAGVGINSEFSTRASDFGSDFLKRMERAYFGFRADGQMVLKVVTDEKAEDWYILEHTPDALGESRVKIGKGLEARYWRFRIANKAGSDFHFDSIRLMPMVVKKRV